MLHDRLESEALTAFAPDVKVGLLATRDADGRPHVSLITSLAARDETHLMFGQFSEGWSKQHLRRDPRAGFLVLTLDRRLWRGKARWTGAETEGADHQAYNARPMFRYNAYFGVHTVHHLELVATTRRETLPLVGMLAGGLLSQAGRLSFGGKHRPDPFNAWTRRHLQAATTLKFLAWTDPDGYPRLVPCVPCALDGRDRLLFATTVHGRELGALQGGTSVAVFALNLQTESVLLRGTYRGARGLGPARLGALDIDWVYNSMPPTPGPIYPSVQVPARPPSRCQVISTDFDRGFRPRDDDRL
jgi:hypothetical protein